MTQTATRLRRSVRGKAYNSVVEMTRDICGSKFADKLEARIAEKERSGNWLAVSRPAATKLEANRILSQWRKLGGKYLRISGQRGSWKVMGRMKLAEFARFCANEAREQQRT